MAASKAFLAAALLAGALFSSGLASGGMPAFAADVDVYVPDTVPEEGVACLLNGFSLTETNAASLPWSDVWYGHFSGGRPSGVQDVVGREVVDWRDEHFCFPSKHSCNAYMTKMRRAFHRPEGYWTCLQLR
ncbi:hypothetical protein [Beijerinckia indica]|uniref:Uncharacterized protein n=1 Tax=Beijerinckia indica subsp. indica (strain ATCC 9039 / DSM 1715 / NCIMB 8712) TaxID=395963 RepID=B2ID41_BEII9|nr:hypothetical protein [Beijerinckia indica]ACB96806.1 hypothetical protein Bind_3246 [Beijerinckia indica subsp. indica ATCC 9039]